MGAQTQRPGRRRRFSQTTRTCCAARCDYSFCRLSKMVVPPVPFVSIIHLCPSLVLTSCSICCYTPLYLAAVCCNLCPRNRLSISHVLCPGRCCVSLNAPIIVSKTVWKICLIAGQARCGLHWAPPKVPRRFALLRQHRATGAILLHGLQILIPLPMSRSWRNLFPRADCGGQANICIESRFEFEHHHCLLMPLNLSNLSSDWEYPSDAVLQGRPPSHTLPPGCLGCRGLTYDQSMYSWHTYLYLAHFFVIYIIIVSLFGQMARAGVHLFVEKPVSIRPADEVSLVILNQGFLRLPKNCNIALAPRSC